MEQLRFPWTQQQAEKLLIAGIAGHKNHGKDLLAKLIQEVHPGFHITHFSDTLKRMTNRVFGVPLEWLYDQELKERIMPGSIEMDAFLPQMAEATGVPVTLKRLVAYTPRELLQYFGTDYVRAVRNNYWCDRMIEECAVHPERRWIIPDVRFANEARAIREAGGLVFRVVRDGQMVSADPHPSERLDFEVDVYLHASSGQIEKLRRFARAVIATVEVSA